MKGINGDTYDYQFLFDHSKGYTKRRRDGLDANTNNISEYKLAAKNEDGEDIPEYSLVELMAFCTDFTEYFSELEAVGEKLGVDVVITTKYHAEIAGEGIEYAWGVAKRAYRKMKLSQKKI